MEIKANSETLSLIFSSTNTVIVPDYQRNFAWQAMQVDSFIGDLLQAVEQEESHFFGPIVLLKPHNDSVGQLIDGQQRLTTSIMFLCILRDRIAKFDDPYISKNGVAIDIKSPIDSILLKPDMIANRFTPNYQIRKIFNNYVFLNPQSPNRKYFKGRNSEMSTKEKIATKELRAAYLRLEKALESWINLQSDEPSKQKESLHQLVQTLCNRIEHLVMRVYSEDDAYILFETLNDRGLRLTPSDLLKSYTLKGVTELDEDEFDAALVKWDTAVENLGSYPFTKFLRHYLLAIQSDKVQSKKIFMMFGEKIKEYGANGAMENLDRVASASLLYSQLLNETHQTNYAPLDRCLKRLNLISETHRVFLLRVFQMNYSKEMKLKAARAVEVLAFRWVLTGENAQELESFYQTQAQALQKEEDDAALEECIKNLLAKAPKDNAVLSDMLHNPAKKDLQFYVLKKLNYGITQVEVIWDQSDLHVEHIAPQKPKKADNWFDLVAPQESDDPNVETYDDKVQKWGNLSLLEFEINSSIKNAEWDQKVTGIADKKGLSHSNIEITSELVVLPVWNSELIASRTAWIARAMVALSSPDVITQGEPNIAPYVENWN